MISVIITTSMLIGLLFAKTYGGALSEIARFVAPTPDGGFIVAGETESFGAGYADVLILKLASDGSLIWAKTYGGNNFDHARSMCPTQDEGFVVAGQTYSFGLGNQYDVFILKLASDGSLIWAKTYGGTEDEYVTSVSPTTDGGFVVAATTRSFGAGDLNCLILKLASDGSLIWAKTYGGTEDDYVNSIFPTTDGGFVLVGHTLSFVPFPPFDVLLLKLASDGSLSWARVFGRSDDVTLCDDWATWVASLQDGGLAIAGTTTSFGAGMYDFLLLRAEMDGNYPGCFRDCTPMVQTVSPFMSLPSVVTMECSPTTLSLSLTVGTPDITITDVCQPLFLDEGVIHTKAKITCSPFPGGVIFVSPERTNIRIYEPDGRLAYYGELVKGENRINLEKGIYLWTAGVQKGRVIVR
ncbi:MAG: hypothetical protein ABIM88_05215 [candidate division WOR-3 bacterium]